MAYDFSVFQGQDDLKIEENSNKGFEKMKEDGAVAVLDSYSIEVCDKGKRVGHRLAKLTLKIIESKKGYANRLEFKDFDLDHVVGMKSLMQSVFNVDQQLANDTVAACKAAGDDEEQQTRLIENMIEALGQYRLLINLWPDADKNDPEKVWQKSKIKGVAPDAIAVDMSIETEAEDTDLVF